MSKRSFCDFDSFFFHGLAGIVLTLDVRFITICGTVTCMEDVVFWCNFFYDDRDLFLIFTSDITLSHEPQGDSFFSS